MIEQNGMAAITDGVPANPEGEHEETERQAERTERGKGSRSGIKNLKKFSLIVRRMQLSGPSDDCISS